MGTSNYLFFQNVTYMAFMIFVLFLFIKSIYDEKGRSKRLVKIRKLKNLLFPLIDKLVLKNNI